MRQPYYKSAWAISRDETFAGERARGIALNRSSVLNNLSCRRGIVLIYVMVLFVMLTMIASLAIDYGRVQSARGSLCKIADASARASAWGVSDNTYFAKAQAIASASVVDGLPLTLNATDVTRGNWNGTTFTANATPYNAVKVTATRSANRGTGIPTLFASIMGRSTMDIHASAIATFQTTQTSSNNVAGGTALWYADLANGTQISDPWGYDLVDGLKPQQASGIPIVPGAVMNFNASGAVSWSEWTETNGGGGTYNGPEGSQWNTSQAQPQYLNGISDFHGPGGSLIAVFLDSSPSAGKTPPDAIDYSTNAALNKNTLSPTLRQVFYVGTGSGTDGLRNITVPNGATRLMFGYADAWIWRDNIGSFSVTSTVKSYVKLVQSK